MFQSRSVTSLLFSTFLLYHRVWTRRRSVCLCTCRRDHSLSPSVELVSKHSVSLLSFCYPRSRRGARVKHLCLSVCLSVRMRNSITTAPIDLIFQTSIKPVCRSSSNCDRDLDSRIYLRILRRWEIRQKLPSKYATTMSNVRYENIHYDVTSTS